MESTGIADQSLWVPEFEFYLFNEAEIHNGKFSAGFKFTSAENKEDLPFGYKDKDGTAIANRKGYHIDIPFDKYAHVREEMAQLIELIGCLCAIIIMRLDFLPNRKLKRNLWILRQLQIK